MKLFFTFLLILPIMMGCNMSSSSDGNQAPYPVTTSETDDYPGTPGLQLEFVAFSLAGDQYLQLKIDEIDGEKDPDGDTVFFRSGALPAYMSLDENTGLVTITGSGSTPPVENRIINFWSEDSEGLTTETNPLTVEFVFVSS